MLEWAGEDFAPDHFEIDEVHFGDPQMHWAFHFGSDADTADAAAFVSQDDFSKTLRAVYRKDLHDIWQQKHFAKIMLEHEDEFFKAFEFADAIADREFDPDTGTNPYLHMAIHSVIENQLESKDPVEALQFYNAMRQKKCSRHATLHLMGAILAPFMLKTLQNNTPFDLDSYKKLLKKYKNRNPSRIPELLQREPLFAL